ncbi:hypothetical protein ANACOL_01730 [Anaerotruncus colihominis DSM 17241]|uniref:Uncharacterized protein n=1 Tax=Anaerotruncus colihominis DSM 17241 TaxID=445972 RepID=B0PAD1_9FIRM|nr:hypothetical protein ANACOL_01730 [Anaerotruncus colihominis DSM 17241]OUO66303.1 hypothetical protein B5F55_14000 [Anaerotruncus colihominis]
MGRLLFYPSFSHNRRLPAPLFAAQPVSNAAPVPLFAAQPAKVFCQAFFQKSGKAGACKIRASRIASVTDFAWGRRYA